MSEKKDLDDYASEEASSQAESYDANKSGTSETYDMKDFCPGIRIEAKDFDGKWYPAKVSDVDWTENEILVHFENWNTKFDEWIPMDSSRLRPIQKPTLQQKDVVKFSKGEEVLAMWSPYQKYPARIQAVLANDRYDVLFYDGFLKRLKSHKISKLEGEDVQTEVKNFTDIGTKEERRERKRKINVAELFHINKRSKKKGLVHSKSQDIKTYPVTKSRNRSSLVKKLLTPPEEVRTPTEESKEGTSNYEANDLKPTVEKILTPTISHTPHTPKALVDTIPAAFEVKYLNGRTEMWSKQLYQRSEGRTAGKLDIVILNPQGRKFRSRNEIMRYCEENGIVYSHEAFDFSAKGRPKSKPASQTPAKTETNVEDKEKDKEKEKEKEKEKDKEKEKEKEKEKDKEKSLKKGLKKLHQDINLGVQSLEGITPPPPIYLPQENIAQNKVFIGDYEVAIENGKFICPVKTCAKHFRRENLLHMHMKHYHPEFSKYLDYTPSVTDLAYARTVGNLDAVDVPSPAPRKIVTAEKTEKISTKSESTRKSSDVFADSGKEPKKLKGNERTESKNHSLKSFTDTSTTSAIIVQDSGEDNNLKNKSSPSSSQLIRSALTSNENEVSSQDSKENILGTTSVEPPPPVREETAPRHNLIKSVRHHKLHSRKKANRYQGSFAEHIRKKRFISQDHTRSHNRAGRQQRSPQLGQQVQQVQPSQTTISSHSYVEDTNSNASSQAYAMARYPKPHLNVSNDVSGKNNLLSSCKNVSPVSEEMGEREMIRSENAENVSYKNDDFIIEAAEVVNRFNENREIDFKKRKKYKENKQSIESFKDKRRVLTELLKRKENKVGNRLRKKRSGRKKNRLEDSRFESTDREYKSGLNNKPNERVEKGSDNMPVSDGLNEFSNENIFKEMIEIEKAKQNHSNCEGDIESSIEQSVKESVNTNVCNDSTCYVELPFPTEPCETKITLNMETELGMGENLENVKNKKKFKKNKMANKSQRHMKSKSSSKRKKKREKKALTTGTENEGGKIGEVDKEREVSIKSEDLPESFVLLEKITLKDINTKFVNVFQDNNENVGSCHYGDIPKSRPVENFSKNRRKRKEVRSLSGKKGNRRGPRKKVRFEDVVTRNWIDVHPGMETSNSDVMKIVEKIKETVRRDEHKKRLTESKLLNSYYNENEMNLQTSAEDCSIDEKYLLNNLFTVLDQAEGTEDSKSPLAMEIDKVEKLRKNEIINCLCGITEEDGLMIQCDICLCWQHGHCAGILRELDVPDKYTCAICKNPYRARSSMKYMHDQEWLKEGTLPSLSFRSKREDIINQRKTMLKRSHDLSGSIALLAQVIHSLRVKVNIAEKKDHPKLWLWAKKWTEKKPNRLKEELDIKEEKTEDQSVDFGNGLKTEGVSEDEMHLPKAPEPEAPIDSAECRLNLLDHLIHYQTLIDARLSCIESLVAELESMQDDAVNDEAPDRYPRTKATVQMLLRDLNTMQKIAMI